MKKTFLLLALLTAMRCAATNITNYLQIVTADNGQLILLSDIGAKTNYNITVSNFVRQVSLMIATNNNVLSGSNYFTGPVVVNNGNAVTYVKALGLTNSLNWLNPSAGTPGTPGTVAAWQVVTNNGTTGWIPIYR